MIKYGMNKMNWKGVIYLHVTLDFCVNKRKFGKENDEECQAKRKIYKPCNFHFEIYSENYYI